LRKPFSEAGAVAVVVHAEVAVVLGHRWDEVEWEELDRTWVAAHDHRCLKRGLREDRRCPLPVHLLEMQGDLVCQVAGCNDQLTWEPIALCHSQGPIQECSNVPM
jgi:hypothetical protein